MSFLTPKIRSPCCRGSKHSNEILNILNPHIPVEIGISKFWRSHGCAHLLLPARIKASQKHGPACLIIHLRLIRRSISFLLIEISKTITTSSSLVHSTAPRRPLNFYLSFFWRALALLAFFWLFVIGFVSSPLHPFCRGTRRNYWLEQMGFESKFLFSQLCFVLPYKQITVCFFFSKWLQMVRKSCQSIH